MEYVSALKFPYFIIIIECFRAYRTGKLFIIYLDQAIGQIAELPRRQALHRCIRIGFSFSLRDLIIICQIKLGQLFLVPIGPVVLPDQAHLLALTHLVRVVTLVH